MSPCWSQDNGYIDSLKMLLKREPDKLTVLNDLAYEYTYKNLDSARILLLHAIEINKTDSLQLGISKETLAIVNEIQGNIPSAISLHFESIKIFEKINSPKHLAWAYNGMGALHYQQYDYDKALNYFLQSMQIRKGLNDEEEVAKSMINIALIFNTKEQYDSSLVYLKNALPPFIESGDELMKSIVYTNLGSTYSNMNDFDNAAYYFNKSRVIQERIDDKEGLGVLYRKLGELFISKNEPEKALAYYDLSLKFAKELGDIGRFTETTQSKYLVYQSMGKFKKAFELQTEYLKLRDSLINIENKDIINEYSAKYENEQKERTITELELHKKNAELALAKSANQLNLFISGFILLIVLSGFIFYRFQVKKKTSEILSQKNQLITKALEERETLLQEIHHRVKNNLQIISSLLKLQARNLSDEAAIDAVKEGESRVKSMALIHQRLYSADDVRGVNVQEYFESLMIEIFQTFGVSTINHQIKTGNIKLDIDTMIPLGLIVNELITNALKYAFEENKKGKLYIEIEEKGEHLWVEVRDNGSGIDADSLNKSDSFGWKMIQSLSRKLKAQINIINNEGTTVQLVLSRYKLIK